MPIDEKAICHVARNVIYAEVHGVGLLMDVYTPAHTSGPGGGYGIVVTTSGGWSSERGMVEAYENGGFFDALCQRGFTAFAVRPGSRSAFTIEQMVENMHRGIRYVRAHAGEYGISPQWLGLAGVSAGGHLSLLTGMRPEPGDWQSEDPLARFGTDVQAVVAFCPPTDFLDWHGQNSGLDLIEWSLAFGEGPDADPEERKVAAARAVSPVYEVQRGLPPVFLAHGAADSLVPVQQSEKLARVLREAEVPTELVLIPNGEHNWDDLRCQVEPMADWLAGHVPAE